MDLIKIFLNNINTIMNIITKLKNLSQTKKIILALCLGYLIYVTFIQVENFVNETKDKEEKEDEEENDIQDTPIERSMFDNLANNLGLER